jgi:hypothetical protein
MYRNDASPEHSILELLCILPRCGSAAINFSTKMRHNLGDFILIFTQIVTANDTTYAATLKIQNMVHKTLGFSGRRCIRKGTFPGLGHHGESVFVFAAQYRGGFQLLVCVLEGQLLGTEHWREAIRDGEEGKGEGGDEKAIHHGSLLEVSFRNVDV